VPYKGTRFRNTFTEADEYPSTIAIGRIINVDYEHYTVDVQLDYDGSVYRYIQVGMPYFHYSEGDGFYAIPEVGARCVVAIPSESSDPVILCFLALADTGGPQSSATEEERQTSQEGGQIEISYRNNRPPLRPGDIAWRGRDGNFVILRRGGIVQIGSTAIAQRIYLPIRNFIKDFAENYSLNLSGGTMSWELQNEEGDGIPAICRFIWREKAEDKEGSVICEIGDLGDNYFRFSMAPKLIDMTTGEIKGDTILSITFTKEGDEIFSCQKQTITVNGDRKIVITGKHDEECSSYKQKVSLDRTIEFGTETKKGDVSSEDLSGSKTIKAGVINLEAGTINLGSTSPAVKGDILQAFLNNLIIWLNSHSHATNGAPPSTPLTATVDNILSDKVKLS